MNLRKFLRILIPVCALAAVSCTNEELIVDASQSQRGRNFAEAFKARFDNIDPNHTWVDGSFGKVVVTTDEPANIEIYGLGRSDRVPLRLKRTVVNGTKEVHYDIPYGCKDVVMRAFNTHSNQYLTLDPTNANDDVKFYLNMETRGASMSYVNPLTNEAKSVSAMPRQEIPNVWNQYGSIAPWQNNIPNIDGIIAKFDVCDHDMASYNSSTEKWEYRDEDLGWCFYFHHNKNWPNQQSGLNYTQANNYYFSIYSPSKPQGYNYWIPTYMFTDDADFEAKTGLSSGEYEKKHENGGNHANILPLKPDQSYDATSEQGILYFPAGDYYCFNAFGKRGAFWNHKDSKYGHFYVTNIDISGKPSDSEFEYRQAGGDYLRNTEVFYTSVLPTGLANALQDIVVTAENNPDLLKSFNTDEGLHTTAPGPVEVKWFYAETTTRDYVGYYYVKHINGESAESFRDRCDRAPKYLLLEATCTSGRTQGDTFPLTYYGDWESGQNTSGDFEFPAGIDIQFFVLHGRDSRANIPNPHSGQETWTNNGVTYKGNFNDFDGKPFWNAQDPTTSYGINAQIHPEWISSKYEWLFYDKDKDDPNNLIGKENGWTLNPYYICFSHGGKINEPAVNRISELEFGWNGNYHGKPTHYGVIDHRIDEWYDGNYKPMVAFRYMGCNVVGFEDTPIEQYGAIDWNDCVFILEGNFNLPELDKGDLAFSMCMEDLGDTEDLDYNDLYMVVLQGWEQLADLGHGDAGHVNNYTIHREAPRVIVDMLGGVLKQRITYEDPDKGYNITIFDDVHKAFGEDYADDEEGRVTINTINPDLTEGSGAVLYVNGDYENGNIADVTYSDGAIVRSTRGLAPLGLSPKIYLNVEGKEDWSDFSIIENIPNFKVYVTYENGDEVCIYNPNATNAAETGTGPQDKDVNMGVNKDRVPYTFWIPSNAQSEEEEAQQNNRVTPGAERQFIGDYFKKWATAENPDPFGTWVANQNHTGRRWYDWRWGSDGNWPDNKPTDFVDGTGVEVTHDKYKTYTYYWSYDADNYCIFVGANDFRNVLLDEEGQPILDDSGQLQPLDPTKQILPKKIEFKINFSDTDHHYFKVMTRDTENHDLTVVEIDESGRSTVTKVIDPTYTMNGVTAEQTQYFLDQIAGTGENQGQGFAILWPKTNTNPNSIQISCEYASAQ